MADETTASEASDEIREKVRDLIKDTRIAMVTSADGTGALVSRPMATQDVVPEGDIWFIAKAESDVADELRTESPVNVAYSGDSSWVSVSGVAVVLRDEEKQKELWNTFTSSWFAGDATDPEVRLIRVTPQTAQYWDSPGGTRTMLSMLTKAFSKSTPNAGETGTVNM